MGHTRLLVRGQGFDLGRASWIPVHSARWGCLTGHCDTDRMTRAPEAPLPVISAISDIILILDGCTVYSTRIACHRMCQLCFEAFWTSTYVQKACGDCTTFET